jgi:magnesium transporter
MTAPDHASEALEAMNDEIALATSGYSEHGREIGVSDMQDTIARMNKAEEIVSRCQESQLLLARAARHLRADVPIEAIQLADLLDILIADINGILTLIAAMIPLCYIRRRGWLR